MRRLIAVILAAAVLLTGCCPCRPTLKDAILGTYESILRFFGKLQLTPSVFLIGDRDSDDDYTGSYIAFVNGRSGQDVVFGGISTENRSLKITVDIDSEDGSVNVQLRSGDTTKALEIGVNKTDVSGESYITVEYNDFKGKVKIISEAATAKKSPCK